MIKENFIFSIHDIEKTAVYLNTFKEQCKVFTFTGPLGAGKTTLVQALLHACDVRDVITSPTFTYVNVYNNEIGQTLYHFDLYRLNTVEEFIGQGFEEYIYQPESWAFIEWPEIILPLLDHAVCHVTLEYVDELSREITIQVVP